MLGPIETYLDSPGYGLFRGYFLIQAELIAFGGSFLLGNAARGALRGRLG